MTTEQAKRFKYWQYRTIIATMIGYALFYFVRKNFSFAIPGLAAEYGITNTSFGLIMTVVGLIYGLSRFMNGLIADRMNGRWHMSLGLLLCVLTSFAFGFSPRILGIEVGVAPHSLVVLFGVLLVANNIFQGSGFPPCARLLTHWIPPTELATKMSVWNTSHSIGASLLAILCGYVMGTFGRDMSGDAQVVEAIRTNVLTLNPALADDPVRLGEQVTAAVTHVGAWQWCFWIPALFALAGAVGLAVFLRDTPRSVGLPELPGTEIKKEKPGKKSAEEKHMLRRMVFANPLIWVLSIANFFVYIVRFSVLDWGPSLLKQSKGISLEMAGWLVALFEIAGIVGMIFAGWATDRYLKGRAHRTCVFCMAGTALFIFGFWELPQGAPLWLTFLLLCGAGFCIYGPQALIGIAAANQATKKYAATATGFTGLFGYASTIVSGTGLGYVAQHYGWNWAYITMITMALVGMLVFSLMWRAKMDGYARINS